MLGPQAPKEAVEQLEEELGLNKSKGEQYMMYLKQILSGDFGKSYSYNQPVIELIMERVPNTLLITLTSLLIALVLGVMAGIISAIKQYSMLDYIFMVIALIGVSIWKHALKNALPPIVTVLGLQLATAFTGAILTESIFAWPGMGTMIVSAIDNRDYALIQGVVLFTAIVFVVINLVVDIVYTMINPKVNYENGNGGK